MAERQRFLSTLRFRVERVQVLFRKAKRQYPRTQHCLARLQDALDAEFPAPVVAPRASQLKRSRSSGGAATGAASAATGAGESRKHYFKARRLMKERDELNLKLQRMSGAKEAGQLSEEWVLRVFLAKPNASARSVEQSFADIVGSDVKTVSRFSLNSVRDAWVEMYKAMMAKVGADLVAQCMLHSTREKADFTAVYLVQVQDEADIRLRSEVDRQGAALPSRSLSSKVQQSVLTLHGECGRPVQWPCELEALGDKSAPTLATSFERLLRSVVKGILPSSRQPQAAAQGSQPQAAAPELWVLHVLIGDGIATNEKAAKLLWACVQQQPLAPGTRYLVMVLKCATHQAGLSARSSVIGRAAATGAGGGELHKGTTGVATRLFKYVIPDYFEEFVYSVREWVAADLVVLPPAEEEDTAATGAAKQLQVLYTQHVVPDDLLLLWNNGLGSLRHRLLEPGQDPQRERARLVSEFVQWIVRHLLHVDSHPTLSRFFTFRACVDRMLTMAIIGMPQRAFQVRHSKPRAENQKRLKAVLGFFAHPEAANTLRRTCLAFQLTGEVEAMMSANPSTGETPVLVRLACGEAGACVEQRCRHIWAHMGGDPVLEMAPAANVVLTTGMDLTLRMHLCMGYPVALVRMSKRWFPASYLRAVHNFLKEPVGRLDVGAGLQLHQLAWSRGDEMAACRWLIGTSVQDLVDKLCELTFATSLAVERAHAEVKKWEASKLTHIATASRNAIHMRFLKWREEECRRIADKQRALRRAVRTNLQSLAWQDAPDARPVGVRRRGSGASLGQPPAAASEADAEADASHGRRMAQHLALNRDALAERRQRLLAEAEADLKSELLSLRVPATRPQWAEWLRANLGELRELMRTAPQLRRERNKRVFARPDLPAAVRRIGPLLERRTCVAGWAKLLLDREGWWGLATRDNGVVIVFLMVLRGRTYFLDVVNRAATGVPFCDLGASFLLSSTRELPELEDLLADDEVAKVWEFKALALLF